MNGAELFIKCLENESVEYIFGIPGEENIAVMDVLLGSDIRFITTRHEQGASFMADVYGRLTGRAGVCMATLGPGATNLVTGFADANMDNAPIIAIAGQGATTRMHKESHQILPLVDFFAFISKYVGGIRDVSVIPEMVRKAFKVAQLEKPGGSFIEVPENMADAPASADLVPLEVTSLPPYLAQDETLDEVMKMIDNAKFPVVIAGNGVIRAHASESLSNFALGLGLPVANTFMAKGCLPYDHDMSLGTVGLKAKDFVTCGFERADLVLCVGYDIVEYHPFLWNPHKDKKLVHIDESPAEVDQYYIPHCSVVGDISSTLERMTNLKHGRAESDPTHPGTRADYANNLRDLIQQEFSEYANDTGFPVKPQKIIWDLRQALNPEDIVISDVGAHKMWLSRMYQANQPNTCIISNGFAAMGIGVPGAIAAKLVHPERNIVTVTGDAGFLMNSQEIETALRIGTPIIILIWKDNEYGLITWHQKRTYGRQSHTSFTNPDFVKYAESFGAKGYRVEEAADLLPILKQAIKDNTVVVIDCPVDYSVNMAFTNRASEMVCPL